MSVLPLHMTTRQNFLGISGNRIHVQGASIKRNVKLKPIPETPSRKKRLKRLQKSDSSETNSRILTLLKVITVL